MKRILKLLLLWTFCIPALFANSDGTLSRVELNIEVIGPKDVSSHANLKIERRQSKSAGCALALAFAVEVAAFTYFFNSEPGIRILAPMAALVTGFIGIPFMQEFESDHWTVQYRGESYVLSRQARNTLNHYLSLLSSEERPVVSFNAAMPRTSYPALQIRMPFPRTLALAKDDWGNFVTAFEPRLVLESSYFEQIDGDYGDRIKSYLNIGFYTSPNKKPNEYLIVPVGEFERDSEQIPSSSHLIQKHFAIYLPKSTLPLNVSSTAITANPIPSDSAIGIPVVSLKQSVVAKNIHRLSQANTQRHWVVSLEQMVQYLENGTPFTVYELSLNNVDMALREIQYDPKDRSFSVHESTVLNRPLAIDVKPWLGTKTKFEMRWYWLTQALIRPPSWSRDTRIKSDSD